MEKFWKGLTKWTSALKVKEKGLLGLSMLGEGNRSLWICGLFREISRPFTYIDKALGK